MTRLSRGAGFLLLALMLAGVAASAGAALASGACCAMPAEHGSSGREGPCHSVAPTSCCEANAAGQVPGPLGAPIFATAVAPGALASRRPAAFLAPAPSAPARIALATIVLRL